jgi:dolichol kinase/4-hydroxybenzoate polyprenyltransferase
MTTEYGIPLAIGFVSALMLTVAQLRRRLALDPEATRKIVHIGSGMLAMSFPWLFREPVHVVITCAISALLLAVCRHTELFPCRLKNVLGGVNRRSGGEYYFPLAVAAVFLLSRGDLALFLIPVAVLTFADTAAAVIGSRWGLTRYFALAGRKSVEGSGAFFVVALVFGAVMLSLLTDLGLTTVWLIAWWMAVATTLTESISTGGTDNLSVPLVAYLFLSLSLGEKNYAPWIQAIVIGTLVLTLIGLHRRHAGSAPSNYFGRMSGYLSEMFPIPLRIVTALVYFAGVASMVQLILGSDQSLWTVWSLIGTWTLFGHMVLLRFMDELKDVEIDRRLFPERPLPSGRVTERDIQLGIILVSVLMLVPNVAFTPLFVAALVLLGYSFLMFRYFFVPHLLRDNLLPNLATHNPVVALVVLYTATVVTSSHGLALIDVGGTNLVLLIAFFWPATFAWEIARKIRSPEEENEYVTYSQIFGPRGAVFVAAGAQFGTVMTGLYLLVHLELSLLFPVVLLASFAAALWGHLRFLFRPRPATSALRPWAEAFLFGVVASAFLEFHFGEHFGGF